MLWLVSELLLNTSDSKDFPSDLPLKGSYSLRFILHRFISIMCYVYHCSCGSHDTYKLTSSTSNFIFTVVMKVRGKVVGSSYLI